MKKIIYLLLALMLAATLSIALVSCDTPDDVIDAAVADATVELNADIVALEEKIAALNAKISELEDKSIPLRSGNDSLKGENEDLENESGEKETAAKALESELEAMRGEKDKLLTELDSAKLEICARGIHFYDGESEISYNWSGPDSAEVTFSCKECSLKAYRLATEIGSDENGNTVARFGVDVPDYTLYPPVINEMTFNSDSPSYNAKYNTFVITNDESLVITVKGENLDTLNVFGENYSFCFSTPNQTQFYVMDYMYEHDFIDYVDSKTIVITIDKSFEQYVRYYGPIALGYIYDHQKGEWVENGSVTVNLDFDLIEWVTVNDHSELAAALENNRKIRLGADIVAEEGLAAFQITRIDLAGHSLSATADGTTNALNIYAFVTILDSVGGGTIYGTLNVSRGSLTLIGNIQVVGNAGIDVTLQHTLHLSDYTGGELALYVHEAAMGINVPDGYTMYNESGDLVANLDEAKVAGRVYVRPTGNSSP